MLPKQKNYKTRLALVVRPTPLDDSLASVFPLPGETQFPGPPAMPDALLQLELALSARIPDLGDITNIIKSDVGLTVQILRVAARRMEEWGERPPSIGEMVIEVGIELLKKLVARTKTVPVQCGSAVAISEWARFWLHSRLTALVAEDLAGQSSKVNSEVAYLAGLLSHLGGISSILGWTATDSEAMLSDSGWRMAKAWEFPPALALVIRGDRALCATSESRALFDIVECADLWASRLEVLALFEYEAIQTRSRPIEQSGLEIPIQRGV
jgi:HD-like signal output (HDOD) protein